MSSSRWHRRSSRRPSPSSVYGRPGFRPRLEALEERALLDAISWTCGSGDWATTSCWSLGRLPAAGDDVTINRPGDIVVTHATGNDSIRSLVSEEAIEFTGGSLALNTSGEMSVVNNALRFSAGTLTGPGQLRVTGLLTWTGGTMRGTGKTIAAGGLALSGAAVDPPRVLDTRAFDNVGTATWSASGHVTFANNAVFTNLAGATFDVQGDASLLGNGTFSNLGTFRKSAGAGVTTVAFAVNQSGIPAQTQVQSGTLRLAGGGSSSRPFALAAGTVLNIQAGTYTFQTGTTVTGTGLVQVSGGTLVVTTDMTVANLEQTGGTLTSGITLRSQTFTFSGGLRDGAGGHVILGTFTWMGGGFDRGWTAVETGGIWNISGSADKGMYRHTIDNKGAASWTGTGAVYGSTFTTIINRLGASFTVNNDASLCYCGGGGRPSFINEGLFRKAGGVGTTSVGYIFNNSVTGTVQVQSGTLVLGMPFGTSSGNFTVAAGSTLLLTGDTFTPSSSITGAGNVRIEALGFTATIAGTYDISGNTFISGAANFIGTTAARTGTLTFNGLAGFGILTGSATVSVTGLFTWASGTMSGSGRTSALGGMQLSGADGKTLDGRTLENRGNATWTGGNLVLRNGAVLTNVADATLTAQGDVSLMHGGGAVPTFTNAGTFRKASGTGVTRIEATFTNPLSGTVDVQTGTVHLAGAFTNYAGARLSGGTYYLRGRLRFNDADIRINESQLILDGPAAGVVDQFGVNALQYLAANWANGVFALANGHTLTVDGAFRNEGLVALIGPASRLGVGGTYTQAGGVTYLDDVTLTATTVNIGEGTVLAGSGTINGHVCNAGQLDVGDSGIGGSLSITGNYTQTATGLLNLELGNFDDDNYDRLNVAGTATFDGAVAVVLLDDFVAREDDCYGLLTAGAFAGGFREAYLPDLGEEFYLEPVAYEGYVWLCVLRR